MDGQEQPYDKLRTMSRRELEELLDQLEQAVTEGHASLETYDMLVECVRRLARLDKRSGLESDLDRAHGSS